MTINDRAGYDAFLTALEFVESRIHLNAPLIAKALGYIVEHQTLQDEAAEFDFPDYCGIPNDIADYLTSDDVDFIQNNWYDFLMWYFGNDRKKANVPK